MNCCGSLVIFSTARALRFPWWCSSMMRVRRAVTSAYSAATKKAFSRIRIPTPINSRVSVTPTPGAHVLEGSSSTSGAASIGDAPVVLRAGGAIERDEPFEMGERLGHREPPLDRSELASEGSVRDVVTRAGLGAERRFGPVEPLGGVRDE